MLSDMAVLGVVLQRLGLPLTALAPCAAAARRRSSAANYLEDDEHSCHLCARHAANPAARGADAGGSIGNKPLVAHPNHASVCPYARKQGAVTRHDEVKHMLAAILRMYGLSVTVEPGKLFAQADNIGNIVDDEDDEDNKDNEDNEDNEGAEDDADNEGDEDSENNVSNVAGGDANVQRREQNAARVQRGKPDVVMPDLVVQTVDKVYVIDVSTTDPTTATNQARIAAAAAKKRRASAADANGAQPQQAHVAAAAREREKCSKYSKVIKSISQSDLPFVNGRVVEFVPAVFETTGAIGYKLGQFLETVAIAGASFVAWSPVRPHVSHFVQRARALLSVALAEGHAKGCAQTAMRMAMGKHSHARFRQFFKSPSGLGKKKRSALSNERNRALYHGE